MKTAGTLQEFYLMYRGGSTLNLRYLPKEMRLHVDSLGSENILALTVGVTTGAALYG